MLEPSSKNIATLSPSWIADSVDYEYESDETDLELIMMASVKGSLMCKITRK